MYLLDVATITLHHFPSSNLPRYLILSHTWSATPNDEVSFRDLDEFPDRARQKPGYKKLAGCCAVAKVRGYAFAWVDSCCIDKRSSAELSEAINSMYQYYREADICIVYLADVDPLPNDPRGQMDRVAASKWVTRGWTLQELIAPRRAVFLASDWSTVVCTKNMQSESEESFALKRLEQITGVWTEVITGQRNPGDYAAAEVFPWVARRRTTRDEDLAYCLMGLFDVHMPVLYGEGLTKAFGRLQREILRTSPDETLFAWRARSEPLDQGDTAPDDYSGLLARSPAEFEHSRGVHQRALWPDAFRVHQLTNMGISMEADLYPVPSLGGIDGPAKEVVVMTIGASYKDEEGNRVRIGLYLEPVLKGNLQRRRCYRRVRCGLWTSVRDKNGARPQTSEKAVIFVLDDDNWRGMRWIESAAGVMADQPLAGEKLI